MENNGHYYSYGSYLVQPGSGERSYNSADSQGDLGHLLLSDHVHDLALEKAAKKICTLKCGLCPLKEEDFFGCQVPCHEDIRPWQCWVAHFKKLASEKPATS